MRSIVVQGCDFLASLPVGATEILHWVHCTVPSPMQENSLKCRSGWVKMQPSRPQDLTPDWTRIIHLGTKREAAGAGDERWKRGDGAVQVYNCPIIYWEWSITTTSCTGRRAMGHWWLFLLRPQQCRNSCPRGVGRLSRELCVLHGASLANGSLWTAAALMQLVWESWSK